MKITFKSEEVFQNYIENEYKELIKEIKYRDKILTQLENYIKTCGSSYPNGRQFFIPYKCVDDIKHILYDVDDYIKVNNLGVDKNVRI